MTPAFPVETLTFDQGLTARIHHDCGVENPFSDDDAVRIVVLHRRYLDPADGECGRDPDELAVWERANADRWFTIPLFLYDHSGVIYRVGHSNPFHCRWDSGRVGTIALKRSAWGNGNEPDDRLAGFAAGIAEDYTSWANGECYGFVLCDSSGEEIESCWGYIGIEPAREEAARAAAWQLFQAAGPGRCVMTCPLLLARLDAAEARLGRISAATHGHGVEVLWLDESSRHDPSAVPDAFYVNRGDPYVMTLLYDVVRDEYLDIAWGDCLEAREAGQ